MTHIQPREAALLETIRQGIFMASTQNTAAMLGDRRRYVGVSEIAKYRECPRAAVMAKFQEPVADMSRILTTQRGHWFENGIHDALTSARLSHFHQLEIAVRRKTGTIMAHLDFTLVWNQPKLAVRVLEVKSTAHLPKEPYPAHVYQAQAQINLLRQYWNKPVFSLRNPTGETVHEKLTFPELCAKHLGVEMPTLARKVSLESWLLYLSMQDAQAFGPYVFMPESLEDLFGHADEFWVNIKEWQGSTPDMADIPFAEGYYPLCSWCDFNADCPKFKVGDYQPQWEEAIQKLADFKNSKEELQNEITEIENALKHAHKASGTNNWITTGSHRFRMSTVAGRKSLDQEALKGEITAILHGIGSDIDVGALFGSCMKQGTPYPRLTITPVN